MEHKHRRLLDIIVYAISWALFALASYQTYVHLSLHFSAEEPRDVWYFFSSDTLVFASIYRDFFIDGFSWSGWAIFHAPDYLDMIWYFFLRFVTGNFIYAHVTNALIQPVILVLAFDFLCMSVSRRLSLASRAVVVLAGAVIVLLFAHQKALDLKAFFWVHRHAKAAIMSLLCLGFAIRHMKTARLRSWIGLLLCTTVTVMSDPIFLMNFVFPACLSVMAALLLKIFARRAVWTALLCIAVGSIIGILLNIELAPFRTFYTIKSFLRMEHLTESISLILRDSFFQETRIYHTIVVLCWLATSVVYMIAIAIKRNERIQDQQDKNASYCEKHQERGGILFFLFYGCLMIAITIVLVVLKGDPVLTAGYTRYFLLLYTFSFLGLGFFILLAMTNYLSRYKPPALVGVAAILVLAATLVPWKGLTSQTRSVLEYYPPVTQCLDELADTYELEYGLGGYWVSSYNTHFSRKGLRIYPVRKYLRPHILMTNIEWWLGRVGADNHDYPQYSFYVHGGRKASPKKKVLRSWVMRILGWPKAVKHCHGWNVLIFDKRKVNWKIKKILKRSRMLQRYYKKKGINLWDLLG